MSLKYSDQDKKRILQEKIDSSKTIFEICKENKISVSTYYQWKNEFANELMKSTEVKPQKSTNPKIDKYDTLKRLYIGLSEQNYELAKFLEG